MGQVATARGRIGIQETGKGERTPILFLHGVGSDKSVWAPQLVHFGRSRRAVALDYPGYGESDFIEDASRDDYAAAALAAMDALGIGKAHVCGLSLGGVVAIAMSAAAPGRCASLIIADSFAAHPDGQGIHDRSIAASQSMSMRALAEARAEALLASGASAALRADIVATMGRIDPQAFRLGAAAVWLADQRDRAANIKAPTLILVGTEDKVTPPALSDELGRLVAGSSVTAIEGAGHLANAERPESFNAAIDLFLDRIERQA